jgi:GT2 family glycosyltransferase
VDGEGRQDMTIRGFPMRFGGSETLSRPSTCLGARVGLANASSIAEEREVDCDWTSGSFMLARREAIESAGFLDERFFMYSEETDLCRRISSAGWKIRHLPWMTIRHYGAEVGVEPRIESLSAYNRIAYARKHFSPVHRALYFGTVLLRHSVRFTFDGRGELGRRAGRPPGLR